MEPVRIWGERWGTHDLRTRIDTKTTNTTAAVSLINLLPVLTFDVDCAACAKSEILRSFMNSFTTRITIYYLSINLSIYIYVQIHTYVHTYIQTYRHAYIQTYIHACI